MSADKDLHSLVDEVAKQVLRVTQLSSEVSRYKAALEKIGYFSAVSDNHSGSMATIARNALKDGP